MVIFAAILILIGYVFAQIWGNGSSYAIAFFMSLAFGIAIIMSLIGIYFGDQTALSISKAKLATKKEHAHYINAVEGLCIAAQIPVPKIYVIPDDSINAFATGRDPKHASIAVTRGAIKKLTRVELEGVIAHELAHIKNYDIRVMTLAVILTGLIAIVSDIFLRSMFFGGGSDDNKGNAQIIFLVAGIVLAILAPLIAQLIQLAVSRKREYLADATGALLTRHPEGLASALRKIEKENLVTQNASPGTEQLYIAFPLKTGFWNNMFNTHPPITERIRRLEMM